MSNLEAVGKQVANLRHYVISMGVGVHIKKVVDELEGIQAHIADILTNVDEPPPEPALPPPQFVELKLGPRAEAWIRILCAVSSAPDCKSAEMAVSWSNYALTKFDCLFPEYLPKQPEVDHDYDDEDFLE